MIYPLSLQTALVLAGVVLLVTHGIALLQRDRVQAALRAFPRSRGWGAALLLLAAVWSWWLIRVIDLGEFSNWRTRILIFIPIAAFLTWRYVDEFLAVRALGMVSLLAAEPLLEAAWMRPQMGKLLLVTLVYAWICFALFWIGMPYTLRDQIAWLQRTPRRWTTACLAGIACGAALLTLRLTLHR